MYRKYSALVFLLPLLFFFGLLPLLSLPLQAFQHPLVPIGYTPIINSLLFGIANAIFTPALACLLAFLSHGYVKQNFWRFLLDSALLLPSAIPGFMIAAIILTIAYLPTSELQFFTVSSLTGPLGQLLATVMVTLPIPYLIAIWTIDSLDQTLVDLSICTAKHPHLELAKCYFSPVYRLGALVAFVQAISQVGPPMIIGGKAQTLATVAYLQVTSLADRPGAAQSALLLIFLATIAVAILRPRQAAYRLYRVCTTENHPPSLLRRPATQIRQSIPYLIVIKPLIFTGTLLFLLATGTIVTSIFLTMRTGTISSSGLSHLFFHTLGSPLVNTVFASAIALTISVLLGISLVWLIPWGRISKFLQFFALLVLVIPGPAIGVAWGNLLSAPYYLGSFTVFPQFVGSSSPTIALLAIIFTYTTATWPIIHLLMLLGKTHFNKVLIQTAYINRASPWETFNTVVFPMLRPLLQTTVIAAFGICLTELAPVIFVSSSSAPLLTPQAFDLIDNRNFKSGFSICAIILFTWWFISAIWWSVLTLIEQIVLWPRRKKKVFYSFSARSALTTRSASHQLSYINHQNRNSR